MLKVVPTSNVMSDSRLRQIDRCIEIVRNPLVKKIKDKRITSLISKAIMSDFFIFFSDAEPFFAVAGAKPPERTEGFTFRLSGHTDRNPFTVVYWMD